MNPPARSLSVRYHSGGDHAQRSTRPRSYSKDNHSHLRTESEQSDKSKSSVAGSGTEQGPAGAYCRIQLSTLAAYLRCTVLYPFCIPLYPSVSLCIPLYRLYPCIPLYPSSSLLIKPPRPFIPYPMKQINGSPDDEVEVVIRKVFNSIMSALKKVFKGVHDDKLLIYNSQPWWRR